MAPFEQDVLKAARKNGMIELKNELNDTPEYALFSGNIKGMLLLCYEHERPFQGTLGLLDWRFNGHFTQLMKTQVITGKKGETTYCPLTWNEHTFHFLVMGGGNEFSKELFEIGKKKVEALKLTQIAVAARDWRLKGDSLWVL